jgi:hypothetical protein
MEASRKPDERWLAFRIECYDLVIEHRIVRHSSKASTIDEDRALKSLSFREQSWTLPLFECYGPVTYALLDMSIQRIGDGN